MNSNIIQLDNNKHNTDKDNLYNDKYMKIKKIGFGAFGTVFKVNDVNKEDSLYAMKKFYLDNQKIIKTDLVKRQYDLLTSISHLNIIEVVDYFVHKDNECIVFPYYERDLLKIITSKKFEIKEHFIKAASKQILEGVVFLHEKNIIHRDLKPENILISADGIVKITDFDLTREISNDQPMSKGAVTIYYRPPEIFYGDTRYSLSVDMWSFGCILAEMVLREPIFKGRNEIDVLFKMHEVLGSPNEENWSGCSQLQNYIFFGDTKPIRPLEKLLGEKVSETFFDLISKLLVLNPNKRLNAKEALNHPFFSDIENSSEIIKTELNFV